MSEGPPSLRRIATGVLDVALAGLVVAAAAILCARLWWLAELFTHFRVQGAVGGTSVAIAYLVLRAKRRAAFAAVLALAHVVAIAPILGPPPDAVAPAGLPRFRVVSVNLLTENLRHEPFLDLLRAEQPDVVLAVEVGRDWAAALETLASDYPVRLFEPQEDNFGVGAMVRHPGARVEIVTCGPAGVPSTRVTLPVTLEGAAPEVVTFLSTHPIPPIGPGPAADRNAQLAACAALLVGSPGVHVLAGDLNVTPWSPVFDDLLRQSGLRDSREGFGLQASWLLDFWPLAVPIDHVLHGPELAVMDRRIGPDFGSDHRPVIVDFALLPGSQ